MEVRENAAPRRGERKMKMKRDMNQTKSVTGNARVRSARPTHRTAGEGQRMERLRETEYPLGKGSVCCSLWLVREERVTLPAKGRAPQSYYAIAMSSRADGGCCFCPVSDARQTAEAVFDLCAALRVSPVSLGDILDDVG